MRRATPRTAAVKPESVVRRGGVTILISLLIGAAVGLLAWRLLLSLIDVPDRIAPPSGMHTGDLTSR